MKELILQHFPDSKYSLEKTVSGYFNTVIYKEFTIFITTQFDFPFMATVWKDKTRIGNLIHEDKLDDVFRKINELLDANK